MMLVLAELSAGTVLLGLLYAPFAQFVVSIVFVISLAAIGKLDAFSERYPKAGTGTLLLFPASVFKEKWELWQLILLQVMWWTVFGFLYIHIPYVGPLDTWYQ
jgi:hypothetical protein